MSLRRGVAARLAESASAFSAVFRNRQLRALEAAAAASVIGHWAYAIAVSVYAFQKDGTHAVGAVWLIRMLPAAFVSPFAAMLADRYRRERVMLASDLMRAALIGAAAACVALDAPSALVYLLAGLVAISATPFQPAQSALVPDVVQTPAELTAANIIGSSIESVGFFAGPALAGLLLAVTNAAWVFVATAALMLLSAAFVGAIEATRANGPSDEGSAGETAREALAGFRVIAADPRLRTLVGLLGATMLMVGMLEVLTVAASMSVLRLGTPGVGILNAAFGIGALFGASIAAASVGSRRLSVPFICGALLWGIPVAIIGLVPRPEVAIVLLAVVGAGNTLVDIAGLTLVQRAVRSDALGRAVGVLQMVWLGAIGIGAALAPMLIEAAGIRGALVATGCFVPVLVLFFGAPLVTIDAAASAPDPVLLGLLRGVRTFALLPGATLEQLAGYMRSIRYKPGQIIVCEGDAGDLFFVIAEGHVEVAARGESIATLGAGDHFGEIALLRDVPRTATVRAKSDVHVVALARIPFIGAVSGHPPAAREAETLVGRRIAQLPTQPGLRRVRARRSSLVVTSRF